VAGAWVRRRGWTVTAAPATMGVRMLVVARPMLAMAGAGVVMGGVCAMRAACEPIKGLIMLDGVAQGDLQSIDEFYEQRGVNGNLSRCLEKLRELYERAETQAEKADLCWRLARACYKLLSSTDPQDQSHIATKELQKQLAHDALKYAQEASKVAPNDFRSHYWCGICIQSVGDFEGTRYTIKHLREIRDHFENAVELNPKDGTSRYCIGAWCYSLADLGYFSRQIASVLYATPPTATFEEALEHFLKAEEVEPEFWNKNCLMIAKCYEKLGNRDKAFEWAEIASRRLVLNPEDEAVAQEARQMTKTLGEN